MIMNRCQSPQCTRVRVSANGILVGLAALAALTVLPSTQTNRPRTWHACSNRPRLRVGPSMHSMRHLWIGQSDVTVSMATIRSPFCGYNMAKCGPSYGVIKIKFNPSVYKNVCMITSWPTECILAIWQWQTFIGVLPTRWRWKPAGIEITSLSPYVCVTLRPNYCCWTVPVENWNHSTDIPLIWGARELSSAAGNESVPKITINNTLNFYF